MTAASSSPASGRVWRRARALALTSLAVLIIASAILIGVGRALTPHADHLRPWLERTASEQLGQVVTLERVEAEWPRLTPSLSLIGAQLDDGAGNRLEIDHARLEIHLPNLLDRRANLIRLILLGLDLALEPDDEGRWGFQMVGGGDGDWRQQLPIGDLLIRDATIQVRPKDWPEIELRLEQGSVERRGQQTHFHGELKRPSGTERLDARLLIEHPDQAWSRIRGWLGAHDLSLSALDLPEAQAFRIVHGLEARADLQLWLDWQLSENRLDLDLDLSLALDQGADPLHALARVQGSERTLKLEIATLRQGEALIASGLAAGRRLIDERATWALAAEALDLGALHAALQPWLDGQAYWPQALDGQLERLLLAADADLSMHAAAGRVQQLTLDFAEPLPAIRGLDLELGLDGDRLALAPAGQLTARWRRHIRADMEVDDISGRVLLAPGSIELQGLTVDSAVANATANGWVYLSRPRPFLDFVIDVHRVGPTDPRPYLSYRTIPEPAMNWLDEAFLWVEQASGLVNLHLTAGTRARDLRPGSYQALVDFQGARLDYWPDWPQVGSVDGRVAFIGNQLTGSVERARFGSVELAAPSLEIAELTAPTMRFALQAEQVDAAALVEVLSEIPVPGWQSVLAPLKWAGRLDAGAALTLPFRTMSDWDIAGEVALDQTGLAVDPPGLAIDGLSGTIVFDRRGLAPTVLQAQLLDQVFDLAASARFEAPAELKLEAEFNPSDLAVVRRALGPLAAGLTGASHWSFRLDGDEPDGERGLKMTLEGDLLGLGIDWPPPLDKAAGSPWPSVATLILGDDRQYLEFDLGEVVAGHWSNTSAGWSLGLNAGAGQPPELPARGVRIEGQLEHLALADWLALAPALPAVDEVPVPGSFDLDLALEHLQLPGLTASAAELNLQRVADGWSGRIESAELAGSVMLPLPLDAGRAVVLDLQRLHAPRADPDARSGEPEAPVLVSSFDPRGLPPLSLAIEDLRWGDLALGQARLAAHPIDAGLEVELLDVSGTDLRLQGSGRWIATEAGPQSQFLGRLTSPSLSALVRAAGYEAGLEAERAQVDLDVHWPGAPQDVAMHRLVGILDLRLSDGEIADARPGAGRLLGLASFNAIPRRLMLDFRDVFAAGLRFDDVEGRFLLEGGFAETDGLVLRSTAAVITISGQTDMAARRYDQKILVEPGLGATLPVIGGLAGGPVGAAAGLVLQQILDRPLRGLSEVRYQVTGPWDAPEIKLVDARLPDEPAGNDAPSTPPP